MLQQMSRFFLKAVFFPGLYVLSIGLAIGEFISLFWKPTWSFYISRVLLGITVTAMLWQISKSVRLSVAEGRLKRGGTLILLPPLHYEQKQKRNETMIPWSRRRIAVGSIGGILLLVLAFFAGDRVGSGNIPFFQSHVQACTVKQPAPIITPTPNRQISSGFARPLISITFDDGWESQYTNALPLLCRYRFPATFYIISGYLTYQDYMNSQQIPSLVQSGMELGSHTVDHSDLNFLTPQQVSWELTQSKQTLESLFGIQITDFASPYGDASDQVINQIKRVYSSHRGADDTLNVPGDFDRYDIKCVTYHSAKRSPMGFTTLKSWIDQAIRTKSWLVLAFHQVDNSADEYAVRPQLLGQILAYIASKPEIVPMTIHQALSEVSQQVSPGPS